MTANPYGLLTVGEAAERLRVSPDTVSRLLRRGELAATRVGGRVFVTDGAVRAYLATHTSQPRPAPLVAPSPARSQTRRLATSPTPAEVAAYWEAPVRISGRKEKD